MKDEHDPTGWDHWDPKMRQYALIGIIIIAVLVYGGMLYVGRLLYLNALGQ